MDIIRFDDFTLYRRTRRLTKDSEDLSIGARAFDLLMLLIDGADKVISRDDLMEGVWPDTVVGENNLSVQIKNLRRLLGENAIVTVPGRGTRFALDFRSEEPLFVKLPDQPSIVVLSFANLRGDASLDWLTDGVVEDITKELSRFRDLFVVARNSACA